MGSPGGAVLDLGSDVEFDEDEGLPELRSGGELIVEGHRSESVTQSNSSFVNLT